MRRLSVESFFPTALKSLFAAKPKIRISSSWPRVKAALPRCTFPIALAIRIARFSSAISFSSARCDRLIACFFKSSLNPIGPPLPLVNELRVQPRQHPLRNPLVFHPSRELLQVAAKFELPLRDRLKRIELAAKERLPDRIRSAGEIKRLDLVQLVWIGQHPEASNSSAGGHAVHRERLLQFARLPVHHRAKIAHPPFASQRAFRICVGEPDGQLAPLARGEARHRSGPAEHPPQAGEDAAPGLPGRFLRAAASGVVGERLAKRFRRVPRRQRNRLR